MLRRFLTFSGIDGAGKTTQVDGISAHLVHQGYRVARVTFWDDVAFMSKLKSGREPRSIRETRCAKAARHTSK